MSSELDSYLKGWSSQEAPAAQDQPTSWWDTLTENAKNLVDQPLKMVQGFGNLALHDLPETVKNLADLPGTAAASGLETLGVDDNTAQQLGSVANFNPIGVTQNLVSGLTNAQTPSSVNQELLHPSTDDNRARFEQVFPAVAKLEGGFEQTGQNLGQSAEALGSSLPGLSSIVPEAQNPYMEAYKQGRLADVVIPDIANLALAGDLAGGALGQTAEAARAGSLEAAGGTGDFASGLDRAVGTRLAGQADRLESLQQAADQGASIANKIAGAPINVATAPLRLPLRWARTAAEAAPDLENAVQDTSSFARQQAPLGPLGQAIDQTGAAQWVGQRLAPIGRLIAENPLRTGFRGEMNAISQAKLNLAADLTQPTVALQAEPELAATAFGANAGILAPETTNLMSQIHAAGGELPQGITPGMVQTAQEAATNPELASQLQQIQESWRPASELHGQLRVAGIGETGPTAEATWHAPGGDIPVNVTGHLGEQNGETYYSVAGSKTGIPGSQLSFSPGRLEEQGIAPMETAIDRAIADPRDAVAKGRIPAEMGKRIEAGENVDQLRDEMRDLPSMAPPDLRPAVEIRRQLVQTAADQVAALRKAGDHATADTIEQAASEVATNLRDMQASGQMPENPMHFSGGAPDRTSLPTLRGNPLTAKAGSQSERTGSFLNLDPRYQWQRNLQDLSRRYVNETAQSIASRVGVRAADIDQDPQKAASIAAEHGMAAFDPERLGSPLHAGSVTSDTLFLPRPAMQAFDDLQRHLGKNGGLFDTALNVTDKATRAWKMSLLALKPSWMLAHTFGQMVELGAVKGGFSLKALIGALEAMRNPDLMTEAVKQNSLAETMRNETRGLPFGYNAADVETAFKQTPADTVRDMLKEGDLTGALRQAGSKTVNTPYNVVRYVGDLTHVMAMTAMKLDREATLTEAEDALKSGRISQSVYDGITGKQLSDEQIIAKTNQVMGDMKNMSWQEKEIVRRAVPFFAWTKHLTQLAWRLPIDNPYRVAFTLNIANMFNDPGWNGRSDYEKGAFKLGDQYLTVPWNLYGEGADSRLLSPQGIAGSSSPLIQWPLAAAGINLQKGRMLNQAPNGENQDKTRFIGLGPLAGYLGQQIPEAQLLQQVGPLSGPQILRYDTGEPWLIKGRPLQNTTQQAAYGTLSPLVKYVTGLSADKPDEEAAQQRALKQQATLDKTARRYDMRRARLNL